MSIASEQRYQLSQNTIKILIEPPNFDFSNTQLDSKMVVDSRKQISKDFNDSLNIVLNTAKACNQTLLKNSNHLNSLESNRIRLQIAFMQQLTEKKKTTMKLQNKEFQLQELQQKFNQFKIQVQKAEMSQKKNNVEISKLIQNYKKNEENLKNDFQQRINQLTTDKSNLQQSLKKIIQKIDSVALSKEAEKNQRVNQRSSQKLQKIQESQIIAKLGKLDQNLKEQVRQKGIYQQIRKFIGENLKNTINILKSNQTERLKSSNYDGKYNELFQKIMIPSSQKFSKQNNLDQQLLSLFKDLYLELDQKLRKIINSWNESLKTKQKQLQSEKKAKQQCQTKIFQLKNKLQQEQKKIKQIQSKSLTSIKFSQSITAKFQEQIDKIGNEKRQIEQSLKINLKKLDAEKQSTQTLTNKLIQTEKDLERYKDSMKQLEYSKNKTIEELTTKSKNLSMKLENLQEENEKNLRQSIIFEDNQKRQIANLCSEISVLNNQIGTLKDKISLAEKKISETEYHLEKAHKQVKKNLNSFEKEQNQHIQTSRKLKQAQRFIAELQKANSSMKLKVQQASCLQYFNGHILNVNTKEDVSWFVKGLQAKTDKKVRLTRPLYRMDTKNLVSFHDYIDNIPNIVIVIKMTTGQIIAAYSAPAFAPQTNFDYQEGYIFSFRNRKTLSVKKQPTSKANKTLPKPITYDAYYIMWGNSDIRIRMGNTELYTNFGTQNCSYEQVGNANSSVAEIFLQQERDAEVADYEFFQVQFEKN